MATRKQNKTSEPREDTQLSQQKPVPTDEEVLSEAIGQETETLLSVAEELTTASQNFSRVQEEYRQIHSMQQDMQKVLSQIVQSMGTADVAGAREAPVARVAESVAPPQVQRVPTVVGYEVAHEGRDSDCECTSPGCCSFDIYFDKVRGIQPQGLLEPADMGDTTIPIPTINELEVRLFISLDNTPVGLLLPNLSGTIGIRVPSILTGGGPGLWMPINQVVGRVYVKKGTLRNVTIRCQGSEIDEGIERVVGFKDEHGEATGSITLDCCTAIIYPSTPIDLSFDQGGIGGGQPGAISMAFYAKRVCC
jgi:hypothetical protein